MINQFKQPVNYKDFRHLASIVVTLFIFIAIPITVFVVMTVRPNTPKADVGSGAIRGQSGDLWADVVIGKRDFNEIWSGLINPQRLTAPGGAVVDRDSAGSTKGKLWLWSGIENRIIGVNLDNCPPTSGDCTAVKVIGQPSLTDYGACNGDFSFQFYPNRVPASASTLCGVEESVNSTAENLSYVGMYSKNGNLYVPDMANHRVLIYYDPWGTDSVADEVIGQDDFSGNLCNKSLVGGIAPTNSSLCLGQRHDDSADVGNRHGSGVTLDNSGNLWAADSSNHRVLRFPKQTDGKISKTADIVLGQADFTSGYLMAGSTLNKLKNPNSLRFDASGNLYVSDNGNNRILKFIPSEQKISGTGTVFASDSGWANVYIGEVDTTNSGIWVTGAQVSGYTGTPFNVALFGFDGTIKKSIFVSQRMVGSVGLGKDGSLVATSPTQGTVYFKTPMTATNYDKNIFVSGGVNNSRLNAGHGIAIAGNQLFATDICRVLVWNDPASATNGKAADYVLLQSNFTTFDCNAFRTTRLKSDSDGHVFVKTHKGIYVFQAPVTSASTPIKIITDPIPTITGGSMTVLTDYEGLMGLTPQKVGGQLFLWVTDTGNNRVVRIRDPLGTPKIDVVVGQIDPTSNSCNRGEAYTIINPPPLNYLCLPGALSVDKFNNLYISDDSLESQGNKRILMFTLATFPTNNTSVFFDATATKAFPTNGFHNAFELGFDSVNHMVVGENSYDQRFFAYYLNPLDPASKTPDGFFEDFSGMTYGVTFDSNDNLYVADINRSRILIYKKPFVEPAGNQAPTVTITSHQNDTWYKGGVHKIKADINDDYRSLAKAEFFVDGKLIFTDYIQPFETEYNFSNADGNHNVTVKAYDQFVKLGQSSITIKTDHQGPGKDVVWNTPANGATVSGRVPVSINADDLVSGTKRVDFYVDGTKVASDEASDSFGYWWNTLSVTNGSHLLEAKAYDQPDNETRLSITVNVNNSSPVPNPSSQQLYLTPVAAGTYAEYSEQRVYPAGPTQFEAYDEEVPDDIWSFVFTNGDNVRYKTSGKIDSTKIPSTATISSVEVWARAQNVSGTPNMKILLRAGGVDNYSDPIAITNSTFSDYKKVWTTNPAGGDWTPTSLVNAEIGVQAWHASANAHRVTAVWMVINYVTDLPIVSINTPTTGAILKNNVLVTATASAGEGIAKVDFLVDGEVKNSDSTAPYEFSWNTTLASNSNHVLSAKAYTPSGKTADSNNVNVVVDNAGPSVAFTNPINGSTVSTDSVSVTANVTDQSAINKVDFYVDGGLASTDTSSPYGFSWVTPATNGIHQLTAVATDALGNLGSDAISVTVNKDDTQKPSSPVLTGVVSGQNVNLTWTASTDNKAVTGYYLYRNTVLLASKLVTELNHTDAPPCGSSQAYQARAFDAAGNVSDPSNTVNITVVCSDTLKPTTPTGLVAAAVSSTQINLTWVASTDNVGVTNYEIYRGGSLIATVGNVTSFGNTGLTAATTYSYFIKAKDGAGNVSDASNTASATTQSLPSPGAVSGTVTSSAGGGVSGAKVTTTVGGSRKTAITNSSGGYSLTSLPAAVYSIKYSAKQFMAQTQSVTVNSGTTTIKDITLQKR